MKWIFALLIRVIQIAAFLGLGFAFLAAWGEGASSGTLWLIFGVLFVVVNLLQWLHMRLKRPPPPVQRSLDDYPLPDEHRK